MTNSSSSGNSKSRKSREVSSKGDVDPEDDYNYMDNVITSSTSRGSSKYRKHLGDHVNSSRIQSALMEEAFRGGRYRGKIASRGSLGFGKDKDSDDHDSTRGETDGSMDDEMDLPHDAEAYSADDDDLDKLRQEMKQLREDEERYVKVLSEQKVSDSVRGQHVRNQLVCWEALLDVEMKLSPVISFVNDMLGDKRMSARDVSSIRDIGKMLQRLTGSDHSEQRLWNEEREQLARWHKEAMAMSSHNLSDKTGTFARDLWAQVDDAWRNDRERILKRVRTSRADASCDPTRFDDSDFHRFLVKEWTAFRAGHGSAVDTIAFRSINCGKKPTEGRISKGRRLSHDPHPKLINYMMPVVRDEGREWNDAKIDDLIRSLFK